MLSNPHPLTIYRSSAGSGKTYTLVKEYLKLILDDPKCYKNILAVTFTNKAAAEMKQRILNYLDDLANGRNPKLETQLREMGVQGDIKYTCREILTEILHNYTFFAVQTIDSFFYKVIKSFSRDIGLSLGTQVQLDTNYVLNKVVDDMLRDAGIDMNLTSYFEEYIFYNLDENKSWRIDGALKGLGMEIFKERYQEKLLDEGNRIVNTPAKMREFKNVLFNIKKTYKNELTDIGAKARNIFDDKGLDYKDFHGGKTGFMKWLTDDLSNGKFEYKKRVQEAYTNPELVINKTKNERSKTLLQEQLMPLLRDAIDYINKNKKKYNTASGVITTLHTLGIFDEIIKRLKAYRDEARELLISEFNPLLRTFVLDQYSPFIFEKIGSSYKHFLIDEAQDTSTFQWDNLKPLAENSLSEGGKVVIVGDVKQSIYRWRNGNMNLLLNKIKHDLSKFTNGETEQFLKTNYRSRVEIIEFINSFMMNSVNLIKEKLKLRYDYYPEEGDLLDKVFWDIDQQAHEDNKGGYVNISFIDTSEETDDDIGLKDIMNERVSDTIQKLTDIGYKYDDITILARMNSHCYSIAVDLLGKGIPIVSSESLLIANSPKIRLIISLLRLMINHKNEYVRLDAVFNYMYYLYEGELDLERLFSEKENEFYKLIEGIFPDNVFENKRTFKINEELADLSLYEIAENLVKKFKLSKTKSGRIDAFVTRFLDVVLDHSKKYSTDIQSFLDWWELNHGKISISLPGSLNAVKIMTIHTAKGLQNKVIILPYAKWGLDPQNGKDLIWASSEEQPFNQFSSYLVPAKEELKDSYFKNDYCEEGLLSNIDNLNLLYVAMTRAEEQLYVIVPYSSKSEDERSSKKEKINGNDKTEKIGIYPENTSQLIIDNIQLITGKSEIKTVEFGTFARYPKSGIKKNEYERTVESIEIMHADTDDKYIGLSNIIVIPRYKTLKLVKDKKFADKTNLGTAIHEALSRMHSSKDLLKVLNDLELEGIVNIDNREEIKNNIDRIFRNDTVNKWFSDEYEVKSEADILLPGGNVIRPDRVIIKDNKAVIIDWKTGTDKEEHKAQLKKYADALLSNGYEEAEMYIYNFIEDKIIQVSSNTNK